MVKPVRAPRRGYAVLSTDGGSRGNPGPAAIGYVLAAADGVVLAARGEAIGVAGAAVAEYRALLSGLKHAGRLGLDRLEVRCDARVVVEQLIGQREPTNPRLCELRRAVRDTADGIGTVIFMWVPASANARAHALVAEALITEP
jgi:ribonuclease HI